MTKFSASETARLQKAAEEAIDAQMTYQMQRQQELLDLLTKGSASRAQNESKQSPEEEPANQPDEISEDSQEKDTRRSSLMERIMEEYPELTELEIREASLWLI